MTIMGHHTIERFGTIHLVAANLWTWIRYVLIEESVMDKEIKEIFSVHDYTNNRSESDFEGSFESSFEHSSAESSKEVVDLLRGHANTRITRSVSGECAGADCILGKLC